MLSSATSAVGLGPQLGPCISDIAVFQILSSQRNQVQGLGGSEGIKAVKAVSSCVLQCWMEIGAVAGTSQL